jgi:K+-transporting ATPase A subunit
MLAFNLAIFMLVYMSLITQGVRPLNPDSRTALELSPHQDRIIV